MADTNDDKLQRYIRLADQMESSSLHQARMRAVDRREQMYFKVWDWYPDSASGIKRVVDTTPQTVADHAIAKLCAQPPVIQCKVGQLPGPAVNPQAMADPTRQADDAEMTARTQREHADTIEDELTTLFEQMQQQKADDLKQRAARGLVITAYGVVRICYDDDAVLEPGAVSLYAQTLDPRSLFVKPGRGASVGPELVIYKRRATREELEAEGWNLHVGDIDDIEADVQITVYDCWEKKRIPAKGKTPGRLEVWHCTIADGGKDYRRAFVKPPMDMFKLRGIWRIPYASVAVLPPAYVNERFAGGGNDQFNSQDGQSTGFLDVLSPNWETRNFLLTWSGMVVQRVIDPPKIAFTDQNIEVDATTPGAQTDMRPNDRVEMLQSQQPARDIAQLTSMLETRDQRGTFPSVTYGEGISGSTGINTGRLQASGEEHLNPTADAMGRLWAEVYSILAMMARSYNLSDTVLGTERFEVRFPAMTDNEMIQLGVAWKQLSEPSPDGIPFVSRGTTRELWGAIPLSAKEDARVRKEIWVQMEKRRMEVEMEQRMQARAQNVADLTAQAMGPNQNLAKMVEGEQQRVFERELQVPQAPQPPTYEQPMGQTPVAGPQQAEPEFEWNPAQPQRGM